eukprot:TRINITY_DN134_c0_g1_i8.p1 TRINITY_DN134_c0_g1~~TRINITY_DN134_c0_g1_i8.p1  ORF type:complete len:520 (+),score=75.55 TRINITY_DN134_c0_g1_i8:218-1561(+)
MYQLLRHSKPLSELLARRGHFFTLSAVSYNTNQGWGQGWGWGFQERSERVWNQVQQGQGLDVENNEDQQVKVSDYEGFQRRDEGDQVQYDVVGIGEAIIDFSARVDDSILEEFQVAKGGRRVITLEERQEILDVLCKHKADIEVGAGGSLANTLVGISQLSNAQAYRNPYGPYISPLNVAFTGRIGDDPHGAFFERSLTKQQVYDLTSPAQGSCTGMVIVLTSSDAQRTFLAYPGNSEFVVDQNTKNKIANSQMIVIEGYLLAQESRVQQLLEIVQLAKKEGVRVVLTAGDPGLVARNLGTFQTLMQAGLDVFIGNVDEGNAFFGRTNLSGEELSLMLAQHCSIAVLTDGKNGSYIGAMGQVCKIEPFWLKNPPLDTNGAGDAYAAGILFGLLQNFTLTDMGMLGARLASEVIMNTKSRIRQDQVDKVLMDFQEMQELSVVDSSVYV